MIPTLKQYLGAYTIRRQVENDLGIRVEVPTDQTEAPQPWIDGLEIVRTMKIRSSHPHRRGHAIYAPPGPFHIALWEGKPVVSFDGLWMAADIGFQKFSVANHHLFPTAKPLEKHRSVTLEVLCDWWFRNPTLRDHESTISYTRRAYTLMRDSHPVFVARLKELQEEAHHENDVNQCRPRL